MKKQMNPPVLPKNLMAIETQKITARYKIEPSQLEQILNQTLARYPKLVQLITSAPQNPDIARLSEYRKYIKEVKKQVYYHLRQYHRDPDNEPQHIRQLKHLVQTGADPMKLAPVIDGLLASHVSTKERFAHYSRFYTQLFDWLPHLGSIVDIGCGIHPLSFPFHCQSHQIHLYLAIDKDRRSIDIMKHFAPMAAPARLVPICQDIGTIRWKTLFPEAQPFDLAIMMKFIPVLWRQHRSHLNTLMEVPARKLLITGNTEALTRKQNIQKREEKRIRQFIHMSGRKIIHRLELGPEFGFLIE